MIDTNIAYAIALQCVTARDDPKLAPQALKAIEIMLKKAIPEDTLVQTLLETGESSPGD